MHFSDISPGRSTDGRKGTPQIEEICPWNQKRLCSFALPFEKFTVSMGRPFFASIVLRLRTAATAARRR